MPRHIFPSPYVSTWLYFTAFMVFAMAIIGAITRLTESGLSMVEWRPLIGALPPMNEAEWQRVYDLYRATPQFQKVTFWMELSDFKVIFFWEWFHRLFGRLIGLIYALPLLFFWIRGMIPAGYHFRLVMIFLLGAAQGLMGWYMVKSGLVDMPAVSHFRLAAHLGLAFILFGALLWTAQDIDDTPRFTNPPGNIRTLGWFTFYSLAITMIWGAYVAGKDAGLVYNQFPLMGACLIPAELTHLSPAWVNFFQNEVTIQFTHRWLGILSLVMVFIMHGVCMAKKIKSWEVFALPLLILLQAGLGISTLLTQVWLPLAVLHQAGALMLTGVTVSLLRKMSS
jgi:cytochrome c oxidase assembly protein subunit 15